MSQELISFDAALAIVRSHSRVPKPPGRTERVSLLDAAGRVLAEPIFADADMPPFARSTRDGYACRAAEADAHEPLRVAGSIRAGDAPLETPLEPGTAIEIMTGAPVPEGADCVVMLEHVESRDGGVRLAADRTIVPDENIVARGAEARQGAELAHAGRRINAAVIAAAAACGYAELTVYAKPRVAILSTGDELVDVTERPGPGQIRNSNAPMLAVLIRQAGGEPVILPSAADSAEAIDAALEAAVKEDMILISGGVSAGKFDLVEPVLGRRGARFHFTGVLMQPGKPVVFGEVEDAGRSVPFFGLPGNPISSAATFLLFAEPVIAMLAGCSETMRRFACSEAGKDVKASPSLTRFVPASETEYGVAYPAGANSSGDIAAFAKSNCFIKAQPGGAVEQGDNAVILLIPNFSS